ncbi:hypothetical protein HYU10_04340 [Candidatus Woesearchaeota archaeon]|nr:hypothetical protein [Candidatus Woesearchaeota archaeon]MBI2130971.1 hypothetical protein [Candidatus Woesearchaeota archaeon]MBI2660831.1 hypothetical protein [Candidatus Woesearchaeota archaeon]
MKINKEWHRANRMPKNPTTDDRINWHIEHAKNCSCRKMSKKILEIIREKHPGYKNDG